MWPRAAYYNFAGRALQIYGTTRRYVHVQSSHLQGGSNMTGTDLYVNKPHCAAAVRP